MSDIATTPKPPYYAVIFTTNRTTGDNDYDEMATKMVELAKLQPGFLGIDSAKENIGITVSYWKDMTSIKNWKANSEHKKAQTKGRNMWYSSYKVRVSKVERDYGI